MRVEEVWSGVTPVSWVFRPFGEAQNRVHVAWWTDQEVHYACSALSAGFYSTASACAERGLNEYHRADADLQRQRFLPAGWLFIRTGPFPLSTDRSGSAVGRHTDPPAALVSPLLL
jgi:hypothetical protein